MIISLIAGYLFLLPNPYSDLAKSIISSLFFSSNFYFFLTSGRYGEESELLKPLIHTWSLSIEEQFYIFFPIFLIILIKLFEKNLLKVLFFFFLLSLLLSYVLSQIHFLANFYLLPSRIFELLSGSLLACFELNHRRSHKSYSILNKICPTLGLILIFYTFLYFKLDKIDHPGIITLVPLIGASLIISFSKKGELITELLSNRIFVFFGLISYSLYLWHYPIFAFLRYIDLFNNSIWIKILAIILTIILSILSYYFIERPFRNKNIISIKALTTYIFISVFILLSYSFYVIKTQGAKSRFPSIVLDIYNIPSEFQIPKNIIKLSNIFEGHKKGSVVLIGDSHAFHLSDPLYINLLKLNYKFTSFAHIGDFFYLKNFNKFYSSIIDNKYDNHVKEINNFLKNNDNQIVIVNYFWNEKLKIYEKYFNPLNTENFSMDEKKKYLIENLKLTFNDILNQGHTLILIYPWPTMSFDPPRMINKDIRKKEVASLFGDKNKNYKNILNKS
jgi:peptidoglycan/LPS O-acetylase OafA/YrhL